MSTPIMKIFLIISIAAIGLNADLLDSDKSKDRLKRDVNKVINICDDGKTNLTMDWDGSYSDYNCFRKSDSTNYRIKPHSYCIDIHPAYHGEQYCMRDHIIYNNIVSLVGPYRPIPPAFGEYLYCPKQRYLHAMEGGAIVMLYHPCADPLQIYQLKGLVKGCLRRYIITPNRLLDPKYPLALLSWGCRLSMSYVDPAAVQKFIINHALKGPEQIVNDGSYNLVLLEKSNLVTTKEDTILCPYFKRL